MFMQTILRLALHRFFLAMLISLPTMAHAENPVITIAIIRGRFIPDQLEIPAETKVKLLIENQDDTPEEFDSFDLHCEVLVHANSSAVVYIGPLPAGRYRFEGEFSPKTAQGVVIVK